jgi:F-type H+-transporting ATPase subunit c
MTNFKALTVGLLSLLAAPTLALAEGGVMAEFAPIGAGLAIGLAALGGGMGQGKVASAIAEAIGRNPSASGKLQLPFFVGLALIESLVILGFVVALKMFPS